VVGDGELLNSFLRNSTHTAVLKTSMKECPLATSEGKESFIQVLLWHMAEKVLFQSADILLYSEYIKCRDIAVISSANPRLLWLKIFKFV
jgi:hypothetical protein